MSDRKSLNSFVKSNSHVSTINASAKPFQTCKYIYIAVIFYVHSAFGRKPLGTSLSG